MPKRIIEAIPSWVMMCVAIASIIVTISVGWGATQARLNSQELVSEETRGKLEVIEKEFGLYKIKQGQVERDYTHLKQLLTDLTNSVRETNQLNRELIFDKFSKEKTQ